MPVIGALGIRDKKRYCMSEGWDECADGWDSNDDVIAFSEKAFGFLSDAVNLNGLRVLDSGYGTGLLTEKISTDSE
jgi:hypothetical protein